MGFLVKRGADRILGTLNVLFKANEELEKGVQEVLNDIDKKNKLLERVNKEVQDLHEAKDMAKNVADSIKKLLNGGTN